MINNVVSDSILSMTATIAGTPSDRKSIQLVGGGINVALPLWNITRSANGAGFKFVCTDNVMVPGSPNFLQYYRPRKPVGCD